MNERHLHERENTESPAEYRRVDPADPAYLKLPITEGAQPAIDIYAGELPADGYAEDDYHHLSVIDMRGAEVAENGMRLYGNEMIRPDVEYLLVQSGADMSAGKGYKGLRRGEVFDFGRAPTDDAFAGFDKSGRFTVDRMVSRKQFSIAVDDEGGVFIADGGSTNGTSYRVIEQASATAVEEEHDAEKQYYRDLFALPEPAGRDRFGNDLDRRLQVTEQSLHDATLSYRNADSDVKAIIFDFKNEHAFRDEEMAQLIRSNEELRVKLGMHLLEKLDTLEYLPSRFYGSATKNPNYVGYRNMTSREYAAVLALSMLDGTFKASPSDPVEMKYGEVVRGQHRFAAARALSDDRYRYILGDIKQL